MKIYQYFYRKRGQPESEEKTGLIQVTGFYNANSKAAEVVGSDYVITKVIRRKDEENGVSELSEENM